MKIPVLKPRNPFAPGASKRKAGKHQATTRKIQRELKRMGFA